MGSGNVVELLPRQLAYVLAALGTVETNKVDKTCRAVATALRPVGAQTDSIRFQTSRVAPLTAGCNWQAKEVRTSCRCETRAGATASTYSVETPLSTAAAPKKEK